MTGTLEAVYYVIALTVYNVSVGLDMTPNSATIQLTPLTLTTQTSSCTHAVLIFTIFTIHTKFIPIHILKLFMLPFCQILFNLEPTGIVKPTPPPPP